MMRAILRLFPYVRGLEKELQEVRNALESEHGLVVAQDRYIGQLEAHKGFLEESLREERRHRAGGSV